MSSWLQPCVDLCFMHEKWIAVAKFGHGTSGLLASSTPFDMQTDRDAQRSTAPHLNANQHGNNAPDKDL